MKYQIFFISFLFFTKIYTSPLSVSDGGTGLETITAHNLLIGNGTAAVTLLTPSATSGIPLVSQGSSTDPAYSTAVVSGGGTGITTGVGAGTYAVSAGTTSTGDLQLGFFSRPAGKILMNNIFSIGAFNTSTLSSGGLGVTTIPAHYLPIPLGGEIVSPLAPSATTGIPLVSQGEFISPDYTSAVVAGGGTGLSSFTAYAILAGGTSSSGNVQQISGVGTTGQVLTSTGAGALPAWSNPNLFQTKVFLLTNVEINSIRSTPLIIIPAPGSGKVIQVVSCTCKMTYGGITPFATSSGSFTLRFNDSGGALIVSTVMNNVSITATSDQIAYNTSSTSSSSTDYSDADNIQVIFTNSSSTEFTGGTGNIVQLSVTYKILTI